MVRNDSLEGALGPNGRRGESPRNLCSVRSPWDQRCVQAALGNVWETTASRRWPSGCPKAQDSRFVTGCAWGQAEVRKHAGESGAPFDRHTVEPKKTRVCSVRIPTAARGTPGCRDKAGQEAWSAPERVPLTTRSAKRPQGPWAPRGPRGLGKACPRS